MAQNGSPSNIWIRVRLTWHEIRLAGFVALQRNLWNLEHKLEDRYQQTVDFGMDVHFLGCIGELATAKRTGRYWTGNVGNFDASDVGKLQVRACRKKGHCMILHHEDADAAKFVGVLVDRKALPDVFLLGWIFGREGKLPVHWWAEAPNPAFFVKPQYLRPFPEVRL